MEHGAVLQYRHGCRCLLCRAAWSEYLRAARVRIKNSSADFVVSSELARRHLCMLSVRGIGLRAVAECTGISRESLQDIRNGRQRIRQSTEERIMRVRPEDSLKSEGSWMLAAQAHREARYLISAGMTKTEIAHAMGIQSPALKWWGQKRIRVSTYGRLNRIYRQFKREFEELERAA